jgi:hypothetical protein
MCRDENSLVPAKDEQLEVALSPAMIFPPIVSALSVAGTPSRRPLTE